MICVCVCGCADARVEGSNLEWKYSIAAKGEELLTYIVPESEQVRGLKAYFPTLFSSIIWFSSVTE